MVFQGTGPGAAGSTHCSLTNPSVSHSVSTTLMYSPEAAGWELPPPAFRRRRESDLVGICIFGLLADLDRVQMKH